MLSGYVGAGWLAANWPAMVSAAEDAHQVAKSSNPALEVLTSEQAHELDALTSCLIPTDDKPGVSLRTPADPAQASGFLNVRVADIARTYQEWSAKGAAFLTEPKDHGREIRAYVRDPDGHLIEVGQATGLLD